MSMHLEGPWLSTTGKRKGKIKFRTADQARKTRELEADWHALQKKLGVEQDQRKQRAAMDRSVYQPPKLTYRGMDAPHIPSLDTGVKGAVNTRAIPAYTGDKVIGVTIVHKSCLQPVFTQQQAIDAANMRR